MTIVLFLFLCAFPSPLKTLVNAGADGETRDAGPVVNAFAVEKAAAMVATQRNFMVACVIVGCGLGRGVTARRLDKREDHNV